MQLALRVEVDGGLDLLEPGVFLCHVVLEIVIVLIVVAIVLIRSI